MPAKAATPTIIVDHHASVTNYPRNRRATKIIAKK
jgi:hypothetical protein